MDIVSRDVRSSMMGRIHGKDTKPELTVRKLIHALGFRFRLHRRDLPGSPDIVFPGSKKVIFVHGCYWHRHSGCFKAYTPKSNVEFWNAKFARNVSRDTEAIAALADSGWTALVIWECELRDMASVATRIASYLMRGPSEGRPREAPEVASAR